MVDREADDIDLPAGGVKVETDDCFGAGVGVLVAGELFAGVDWFADFFAMMTVLFSRCQGCKCPTAVFGIEQRCKMQTCRHADTVLPRLSAASIFPCITGGPRPSTPPRPPAQSTFFLLKQIQYKKSSTWSVKKSAR